MHTKYYFTFCLKLAIATILIASLIGCHSVKSIQEEQMRTDVVGSQLKNENSKQEILEKINRILENSKSSSFESNLNLIPNENSKVLRYVEIREGKPYREIEIQGGSLQERKSTKDTIYIRDSISLDKNIYNLTAKIDSLQYHINRLKNTSIKTKKESSWGGKFGVIQIIIAFVIVAFIMWRFKLF